jgi:glutamyl-tRNA reductase
MRKALVHLLRVASRVDSPIVREDQICSQVRNAPRSAESSQALPSGFEGIFRRLARWSAAGIDA